MAKVGEGRLGHAASALKQEPLTAPEPARPCVSDREAEEKLPKGCKPSDATLRTPGGR